MNYKRTILMTTLYTLLALIGVTIIAGVLMYFVFTKTTANLMYNIGCEKVASNLYYKTYEKTGEIEYCYKALNIKINLNDDEHIVEYYEVLISDSEYADYINSLTVHNEKLNIGVLEKSSILNEENYLINKYIKSLINLGDNEEAFEMAIDNFQDYNSWTLKNQGVYALSCFVTEGNMQLFGSVYDGFDNDLLSEMQEYMASTYTIFTANKDVESNVDKAYLLALGNRIINVGQDINKLYGDDANFAEMKSNNIAIMTEVNNVIKGLI